MELRADSALGVPGLIGVVRAGRVVLANGLGSGVLESAAWMGFMPAAAEKLLGEKLRLPSVATWWCGERLALDYVLANIERLVIKPTYPNQNFQAVFGRDLDAGARAELLERVEARPQAYVAQERLAFSQAPVWRSPGAQGFSARALGIRVYAIATASGYRVMPGGLARIASDAADVVSMQRGGGSKDVWVLAADRQSTDEAAVSGGATRAAARHDDLPSSLAENLFWLGRYSERCEDKARLLRATLGVRTNSSLWPQALETCGHFIALSKPSGVMLPGGGALSLFDDANPLGLTADLQRLGWCAAQARSRLSAENWRAIGVLQREFQEAAHAKRDPRETLDALLLSLAALAGFALDDMTQDDGWRLMMVGRRLERLQFLAELLSQRLKSGETPNQSELEWLLDIGDSTITYRTRYLASPLLGSTIDLLVFDQTNPRALAFQWHALEYSLVRVAASLGGSPDDTLDEAVGQVEGMELSAVDGDSARAARARQALAEQLNELSLAAGRLSDRLSLKHFFAHRSRNTHGGRVSAVIRYRVRHETVYHYGGNVAHSHQLLHLSPRDCGQSDLPLANHYAGSRTQCAARRCGCLRQCRDAARIRSAARPSRSAGRSRRRGQRAARRGSRGHRTLGDRARFAAVFGASHEPGAAGCLQVPYGVELCQGQADVHRLCGGLFRRQFSGAGRRRSLDAQDAPGFQLRARHHQHQHLGGWRHSRRAAACARISRTSCWPACARGVSRPAT